MNDSFGPLGFFVTLNIMLTSLQKKKTFWLPGSVENFKNSWPKKLLREINLNKTLDCIVITISF